MYKVYYALILKISNSNKIFFNQIFQFVAVNRQIIKLDLVLFIRF